MIKQVMKFQTNDGEIFNTEQEAQQHIDQKANEKDLYQFIYTMQDQLIYTSIDEGELYNWLVVNAKAVREVLKVWDV